MTFNWAFADGTSNVGGAKVSHRFDVAGVYPVTAVVTDSRGAVGTATVNITVGGGSTLPVITGASISGKKLFVTGRNFDDGAVILINDQRQKTINDDQNPTTVLIGKKAGKNIVSGQTVTLQVRNSDGSLSNQFGVTRP